MFYVCLINKKPLIATMHENLIIPFVMATISLLLPSCSGNCAPFPPQPATSSLAPWYRNHIDSLVHEWLREYQFEPMLSPDAVFGNGNESFIQRHCQTVQVINRSIWVLYPERGLSRPWNQTCCSKACEDLEAMRQNRFNGSFAHNALRLQSALRLISWVIQDHEWEGRSLQFIYCGTDGAMTSSRDRSQVLLRPLRCSYEKDMLTIPWPEIGTNRHKDFPLWDDLLLENAKLNLAHSVNFSDKLSKVVFRGKASHISHTCGQPMRKGGGIKSVKPNSSNWKEVGTRLKLLILRHKRPDLYDFTLGPKIHIERISKEYGINTFFDYEMDTPPKLSMVHQFERFRYSLSVGRNNCWADRLRYLLLSPTLVFLQTGRPCIEFWEYLLEPYVHYVPVDPDLNNLTESIEWANEAENLPLVAQIIRNANKLMQRLWSTSGLHYYARTVLRYLADGADRYSRELNEGLPVKRLPGSRLFSCEEDGTNCAFGSGSQRSGTFDP